VDIYLGPDQPGGVAETNWIQTLEGRNFMGVVRLYGTEVAFFDQTWRPGEMVKQ
jgi:hypothetical protein